MVVEAGSLPVFARELKGHKAGVTNLCFTVDGSYCLSSSQDRSVRLWNPNEGILIKDYTGPHNQEVNDVAVLSDKTKFASVGGDKIAFLWDVLTGNITRRFIGHTGRINCCEFAPSDEVLLTGSYDKTVRLWDLRAFNKNAIQVLDDFRDSVTCIRVFEDEVICGCVDGCIRSYDLRKGKLITDDVHHQVVSVCPSQDRSCLLASCLDDTVRLVDCSSGRVLSEYRGHTSRQYQSCSCFVHSLAPPTQAGHSGRVPGPQLPEKSNEKGGKKKGRGGGGGASEPEPIYAESFIVSASEDHKLYYWNVGKASVVGAVKAHGGPITCIRIHPKTRLMLTGSADSLIKTWNLTA